jgi:hypothetical protein
MVFVIAASTASAKMYYFDDFGADFPKQPEVKKGVSNDGEPYADHKMVFADGVFGIGVYSLQISDVEGNKSFQYGKAVGYADGKVSVDEGSFKGHPSIVFAFTSKSGRFVIQCYVYTSTRLFSVMAVTDANNRDVAHRMLNQFMASLELKDVAPEIRRATPVRNGDTAGEI